MLFYINKHSIIKSSFKSKEFESENEILDFIHKKNKNKGLRSSLEYKSFENNTLFILFYTKPLNKNNTEILVIDYNDTVIETYGDALSLIHI